MNKRIAKVCESVVSALAIFVFVWGIVSWAEVNAHNLKRGYDYNKLNMFVLLTKSMDNKEEVKAKTTEKSVKETEVAAVEDVTMIEASTEASTEAPAAVEDGRSRDWRADDGYLLARIAMAEAENQDTEGKALVMCVVLNRVGDDSFPETIRDVIFEKNQFSPILDGRWDRVEPNEDCYKALEMVVQGWDESQGATYFEVTQSQSTWHSRNLQKLFEHQDISFYKEKEIG